MTVTADDIPLTLAQHPQAAALAKTLEAANMLADVQAAWPLAATMIDDVISQFIQVDATPLESRKELIRALHRAKSVFERTLLYEDGRWVFQPQYAEADANQLREFGRDSDIILSDAIAECVDALEDLVPKKSLDAEVFGMYVDQWCMDATNLLAACTGRKAFVGDPRLGLIASSLAQFRPVKAAAE